MKYQIRKCEKITIWRNTQVVEFDPEDFRNYEDCPYTGNSEKEFLEYINQFKHDLPENELFTPLYEIQDSPEWNEYDSSVYSGEESWLEIGEINESNHKAGGFDSRHDTYVG
jgi:hypothetical protein